MSATDIVVPEPALQPCVTLPGGPDIAADVPPAQAGASRAVDLDAPSAPGTLRFPCGLPGFEACRSFLLMTSPDLEGLQYLTSTSGPAASFLAIEPQRVMPGYRCELSEGDRRRLEADEETPLLWLALVGIEADGTITANLRAPIVINPARMIGLQIVSTSGAHALRHLMTPVE